MFMDFCSLASGSSGNCQYVGTSTTHLLVDMGLTTKYVVNGLSHLVIAPTEIAGILITHEHSDHIKGVGAFHRKYKTPIYCHRETWESVKRSMGKYHETLIHFVEAGEMICIGDISVEPVSVTHDAAAPLAYLFNPVVSRVCVGVVTDLGVVDDTLLKSLYRAQMLLLESNHNVDMLLRGSYPYPLKRRVLSDVGHLSNESCAELIVELYRNGSLKSVFLGHLSQENNTPDLAFETIRSALAMEGIVVDQDIMIEMTFRNRIGKRLRIRY